jgi:hypothetical protein
MYFSKGWLTTKVGDMCVIAHEDRLHLFHLCLPSHDIIAHLVSDDDMNWRPLPNALHVGDLGCCYAVSDDLIAWEKVEHNPAAAPARRCTFTARQSRLHAGELAWLKRSTLARCSSSKVAAGEVMQYVCVNWRLKL